MKTKSKYLTYGTFFLIVILVIVQVTDGFTGILLLPLSRFVYYALTLGSGIPVFVQLAFLSALFILLTGFLKFSLPGFGSYFLQPAGGNAIVYFSSQAIASRRSSTKKEATKPEIAVKKPETETGIVMVSAGYIMFANKAFFRITGFQPLDVFGKDFASFIRPDSLINYTILSRIAPEEIKQLPGIVLITKNNTKIVACFATNIENIFNPDDVNIFNITTEETPENTKKSMDSLFFDSIENVETMHWIWDEKGIIYMNNSCRNNLPFSLGQILSKPGLMLKSVVKEERDGIRKALKVFAQTGKFNRDICCKDESGDSRYFRISISKMPETENFPQRNHALAYDITDEIRSLKIAEAATLEAETANNNKTAFLANMSHEIRSPLNGIIGFSELLADKCLTDAERERYLNIIQNNGNALISLLSDLIDISKLDTGKLEINNRKFSPAGLLEELKHQFGNSLQGESDKVNIEFAYDALLHNQQIESDPNRLRQILVNLITNAIKFTSKGSVEIGADLSGKDMLFWVKDTGSGIPYANQQAVFERFRQVETPDSKPILGFGLGLAISKALVELLGGHLWVESIPDQGSLFVFTIKTNIVSNNMETTQLKVANSSNPYDFKEHTILIAEDIDFSFLYIEAVLRRTGVKILWAQNGKEAIEHVKSNHSIELVLMDMHMPVMNGYDAAGIISSLRHDLPIIAQTAFVLPEDVKKCYASGCTGYISKPIRKEQLMDLLTEQFDKIDHHAEAVPMYRVSNG